MRDVKQLHPELQEKIKKLQKECERIGKPIGISECLRTKNEQNALYAQGRTKSGHKVTNAIGSTYSSLHQWGIAFDFYLKFDVDGDGQIKDDAFNDSKGDFKKIGAIAQKLGLEWGGSWTSIVDKPHLQLPTYGSNSYTIRRLYKTPNRYFTCWSLDAPRQPITAKSSKSDIMYCQYRFNEKYGANLVVDGCYGRATEEFNRELRKKFKWKIGNGKKITLAMLKKLR